MAPRKKQSSSSGHHVPQMTRPQTAKKSKITQTPDRNKRNGNERATEVRIAPKLHQAEPKETIQTPAAWEGDGWDPDWRNKIDWTRLRTEVYLRAHRVYEGLYQVAPHIFPCPPGDSLEAQEVQNKITEGIMKLAYEHWQVDVHSGLQQGQVPQSAPLAQMNADMGGASSDVAASSSFYASLNADAEHTDPIRDESAQILAGSSSYTQSKNLYNDSAPPLPGSDAFWGIIDPRLFDPISRNKEVTGAKADGLEGNTEDKD